MQHFKKNADRLRFLDNGEEENDEKEKPSDPSPDNPPASPTFGMPGSFGADGIDFEDTRDPEVPGVDCTTNAFTNPIFEKTPDGKNTIKWCPGFGDKWRANINLGGAMVDGVV